MPIGRVYLFTLEAHLGVEWDYNYYSTRHKFGLEDPKLLEELRVHLHAACRTNRARYRKTHAELARELTSKSI
jgi:hypothetical protein